MKAAGRLRIEGLGYFPQALGEGRRARKAETILRSECGLSVLYEGSEGGRWRGWRAQNGALKAVLDEANQFAHRQVIHILSVGHDQIVEAELALKVAFEFDNQLNEIDRRETEIGNQACGRVDGLVGFEIKLIEHFDDDIGNGGLDCQNISAHEETSA